MLSPQCYISSLFILCLLNIQESFYFYIWLNSVKLYKILYKGKNANYKKQTRYIIGQWNISKCNISFLIKRKKKNLWEEQEDRKEDGRITKHPSKQVDKI